MSGAAFDGLARSAGEAESYTPGEMPLEVRLAMDAASCDSDDKGQRGSFLPNLAAAARDEGKGFDHNLFLEAYLTELSYQSPEEREEHLEPFLTEMIQALYNAGRNHFALAIDGWQPERMAAELIGAPERRLALSYRGNAGSFGSCSKYCSFTLEGEATYAGAVSDYCDYDLGDSEGMVGYASFACRFRIRSPHQINVPPGGLSRMLFVLRNHKDLRLPLDCAFHVREMGDLEAPGLRAAFNRVIWKRIVLGRYKNVIVREGDAASAGEAEP